MGVGEKSPAPFFMLDPNPVLDLLFRTVAEMRKARVLNRRRESAILSLSVAELRRHEKSGFELDVSDFMGFLIGKHPPVMQRLKSWCDANNCVILEDIRSFVINIQVSL